MSSSQRWLSICLVLTTYLPSSYATAQTVDQDIDLEKMLPERVALHSDWWKRFPQTGDHWVKIVSIKNWTYDTSQVAYGQSLRLPGKRATRELVRYKNCSASQQELNAEYTHQESNVVEVTITNGFKSSSSIRVKGKFDFIVGGEFEAAYNQEVSFMRADKNSYSTQDSAKRTVPLRIPAWTLMRGDITSTTSYKDLPFAAAVSFDADVELEWYNAAGALPNHYQITRKLSWLLPKEETRTFVTRGVARGALVNESDANLLTRSLDQKSDADCPPPNSITSEGLSSGNKQLVDRRHSSSVVPTRRRPAARAS